MLINEQQADGLCQLLVNALPSGEIDAPTQKMLLLAIKVIKGAVANEQSDVRPDEH